MNLTDNIKFTLDRSLSTGDGNSPNILIKGDNKDILPELASIFSGKIKSIYIDPPYNNGDTYYYYNDKSSSLTWIKEMREVLGWLKVLMKKDGSIWISIDDKEMAYLKVEADKIFGRENFAGTIVWQRRKTRENRAMFSCNHEYILVYAKDIKAFKKSRNLLPIDNDTVCSKYKNPDNDPRGPWQSISASVQAGHAVPSQFYSIISPSGTIFNPPKGRCWAYNQERMLKEIADNNIWFGKDGDNTPRIKKFLANAKIGLTPETLWVGDTYGTTDSAKKHLLTLFPDLDKVFDTPKPEELIKQIIEISSNEGDYVLDCFVGSGTTMSAAHKLNRHYIGIEIGDQMTDIVAKRMQMVINGEKGGISNSIGWEGGGQYAFYIFDKEPIEEKEIKVRHPESGHNIHYHQLSIPNLFEQYEYNSITDNTLLHESKVYYGLLGSLSGFQERVLISYIKENNKEEYINHTAKVFYASKRFPSEVSLDNLFYFMPYFKGKGIRDLYFIRSIHLGDCKEGQSSKKNDGLCLIFEIEFIKQLFDDFKSIDLEIWHTYTCATLEELK